MEPRQKQFSIWYFLVTMAIIFAIQTYVFGPHTANLSYSEIKGLIRAGKVADLTLGERVITGTLRTEGLEGLLPKTKLEELRKFGQGEHRFVTVRVEDPALIPELEAAKVRFTGQIESTWLSTLLSWIVPALIFFGLWGFIHEAHGGGQRRPRDRQEQG